jgi:hypothetical protein
MLNKNVWMIRIKSGELDAIATNVAIATSSPVDVVLITSRLTLLKPMLYLALSSCSPPGVVLAFRESQDAVPVHAGSFQ